MSRHRINTAANRSRERYTPAERVRQIAWRLAWPLFRLSPRIAFGWRNAILRLFGARVGRQVHIYNSASIYFPWKLEIGDWSAIGEQALVYNLGPVRIGQHVTISQRAHLCAGSHDHTHPEMLLLKPPIAIGDQAWVCADAFVGPGVTIGEGAVVGARAVVVRDVAAWTIVMGNPARLVRTREVRAPE